MLLRAKTALPDNEDIKDRNIQTETVYLVGITYN